jgi:hypothetical protein
MGTWTAAEETVLVDFLYENRSEAGDGGNFKKTTLQRAATELANRLPNTSNPKDVKSVQNKWSAVRVYHYHM